MQKNDGIIIMDKPQGFTSFDMVAKMRGMLGTRKVGHAGTLDPMATGVLPIFVGRATKCCDLLPDQDKNYTATFELGYTHRYAGCHRQAALQAAGHSRRGAGAYSTGTVPRTDQPAASHVFCHLHRR